MTNLTEDFPRVLVFAAASGEDRGWVSVLERLNMVVDEAHDPDTAEALILRRKPGYYVVLAGSASWSERAAATLDLHRRPPAFLLIGAHPVLESACRGRFPVLIAPDSLTPDSLPPLIQVLNDLRDEAVDPGFDSGLTRKARRGIFETSPVPMAVVRDDGTMVSVNAALGRALGRKREDLIGHSSEAMDVPRAVIAELALRVDAQGEVTDYPVLTRASGGEARHLELGATALLGGGERRLLLVWTDLTDRVHEALGRNIRERLEALGRLAAGVAHHLNNILTPVQGYTELLEDASLDGSPQVVRAQVAECSRQIRKQVRRASEIIDRLIIYSRQGHYHLEPVQPSALVQRAVTAVMERDHPGVRLLLDLKSEDQVALDRHLFERAVAELLENACEAMPQGGLLTVRTDRYRMEDDEAQSAQAMPGCYFRCTVTDTGPGMSEDLQSAVFEPFFTTKPVGQGAGLGLSVAYGVIKGHGGLFSIDSVPGSGTTIHVMIPLSGRDAPSEHAAANRPRRRRLCLLGGGDTGVLAMQQEVCKRHGFESLIVQSEAEARILFEARHADLDAVVIDAEWPRRDRHLLGAWRRREPGLPVILVGPRVREPGDDPLTAPAAEWVEEPGDLAGFTGAVNRLAQIASRRA